MITERLFLAMRMAYQLPEGLQAEYRRIAPLSRLWAFGVLLATWHTQTARYEGYSFERDWTYVSSLVGRFASLRPFIEAAARAQEDDELEKAGAAWSYFVQVAGLGTVQGILNQTFLEKILAAAPPPIDIDRVRTLAFPRGSAVSSLGSSRVRQFDAPRFSAEGREDV